MKCSLHNFHHSTEVLEDLNDVPKENPNCVLLGDAVIGFHYDALNSAFQVLMEHPKLFSMGAGYEDAEFRSFQVVHSPPFLQPLLQTRHATHVGRWTISQSS